MNSAVAAILGGAAFVFLVGASTIADPDYVRLLGFWSLALSAQIVFMTAHAAWRAASAGRLRPYGAFLIGLLLMNVALAGQRMIGIASREFGQSWLTSSDLFSLTVAAMIVAQAMKSAALEAAPRNAVSPHAVVRSLIVSFVVGMGLYLAFWAVGRS